MDRFWFLTWTTYGTWLPGDARGFVSPVWDEECERLVIHNVVGTPVDSDMPALGAASYSKLKCPPVYLTALQAQQVALQFEETACYRGWRLFAYAVMRNHVHILQGVPGDPEPEHLLRDLKAYASRRLNRQWPCPASNTWWTESGSKRKVQACEENITGVVKYIHDQEYPLVMWTWTCENGKPADVTHCPAAATKPRTGS